MTLRSQFLTAVALASLCLTTGWPVTAVAQSAAFSVLHLPVIAKAPARLYGRITQAGVAVAGVSVNLRHFHRSAWSTLATATTDATGRYDFVSPPTLSSGERYQVTFDNLTGDENRLAWWGTRQLASFDTNSQSNIGDFDIAAVTLTAPETNALLTLPGSFRWQRRVATPADNYAVRVYDTRDLSPMYVSPYVGFGEGHTLSGLPVGFAAGADYTWDVILLAADGATGVSRQARTVRFSPGLYGRVLLNGAAVSGVALQLRFFNGSVWSTLANTTTGDDGSYMFANVATLSAGQKLYVRYQNVTQTTGRLFLWSTRTLTTYEAGSAVDLGAFDIADVALVSPPTGSDLSLPAVFAWTPRAASPTDAYFVEIYDPSDYLPRWLSPLVGHSASYTLGGLAASLATDTPYAWDLVISTPEAGSGVSRVARLVRFTNRGNSLGAGDPSASWPFAEELPARSLEGEP